MVEFAFYTPEEGDAITRERGSLYHKATNEKRKEHKNSYMRARYLTKEYKAHDKARKQTEAYKAFQKAYLKAYRSNNKEEINAKKRAYRARKKAEAMK